MSCVVVWRSQHFLFWVAVAPCAEPRKAFMLSHRCKLTRVYQIDVGSTRSISVKTTSQQRPHHASHSNCGAARRVQACEAFVLRTSRTLRSLTRPRRQQQRRAAFIAARSRVAHSTAQHMRVRCATLRGVATRAARPRRARVAQHCS